MENLLKKVPLNILHKSFLPYPLTWVSLLNLATTLLEGGCECVSGGVESDCDGGKCGRVNCDSVRSGGDSVRSGDVNVRCGSDSSEGGGGGSVSGDGVRSGGGSVSGDVVRGEGDGVRSGGDSVRGGGDSVKGGGGSVSGDGVKGGGDSVGGDGVRGGGDSIVGDGVTSGGDSSDGDGVRCVSGERDGEDRMERNSNGEECRGGSVFSEEGMVYLCKVWKSDVEVVMREEILLKESTVTEKDLNIPSHVKVHVCTWTWT